MSRLVLQICLLSSVSLLLLPEATGLSSSSEFRRSKAEYYRSPRLLGHISWSLWLWHPWKHHHMLWWLEFWAMDRRDRLWSLLPVPVPRLQPHIQVVEQSHYPHYLAIALCSTCGKKISLEGNEEWKSMNKAWGGVWDLPNPPSGALKVKVKVGTSNGEQKWVEANKALPSSWKPGAGYDSHVKLA
ncbi:unnamed protein product [Linum tenue]|uniref:Expansin-like CBD domain-containing protein n=1 Tax=Linum tenue TaxID=586396 RepID=A0AAV0Q421_9ROSI|nr:unnamed protein product [Linum tenue]